MNTNTNTTTKWTEERVSALWPHGPGGRDRKEMREEGWVIVEAIKASGGYRKASYENRGSGYEDEITPQEGVIAITRGCPAYYGDVAFKP